MEKKCTKCGEVKSLDEFSNDKSSKDGKQFRCKSCCKEYRKKNKGKMKEYKQYNKEKIKEYNKEYYKNNKEKLSDIQKIYCKNRKEIDPLFKLSLNIRSNIGRSLRRNSYSKKTKTYNILKCEYDFFMEWINGIASNGHQYGIEDLHLDHVVPVSLAETEEEMLLLSHYSNYQLLSADENFSKGNRYVNPVNLARVLEHHPNPDKIREIHARL
jgi:hypothetical protein